MNNYNEKVLNPNSIEIVLPDTVNENLQLPDPILLQFYRDRANRTIWILNEINDEVYDWIDFILDVNREDEKNNIPVDQRKPIKCIFSNYGGQTDVAHALIDIISISKTPIEGYAIGMCASAASQIYLACSKRYALPSAVFLFHQGSCSNLNGSYSELKSFMDDYQLDIKNLTEFYKKHTTFAPEVIEDKLSKGDWYIRVPEALQNGVVHEVLTDITQLL